MANNISDLKEEDPNVENRGMLCEVSPMKKGKEHLILMAKSVMDNQI